MIILDYQKKNHKKIIHACVAALKTGKVVAYPTDTSYGLAADANNIKAIKKLYSIKGRNFNKPVHIVLPSMAYAKNITRWNRAAEKLAKKFWPGALTLVLPLRINDKGLRILSAKTAYIGLRMPKNQIALDLAKHLNRPITATSANRSGQVDSYTANDVLRQFKLSKYKPDKIINAGKLPKRKPSTIVKIFPSGKIEILRQGPVSENQINKVLSFLKF